MTTIFSGNDESKLSNLTLEETVSLIELFPDCFLPEGVLFDTLNEKIIIKTYRYFYKGLKVWLDHLAAKKRLVPEAILTDWKYFQPHAQIYAAYLDLATGVHPRSILNAHFESPSHTWGSLIYLQCKQTLVTSGLFGPPLIHGKTEIFSHNLERLKQYDAREITSIHPANNKASKSTFFWHESPKDYLTVLASDIAEQDPEFDRDYWVPYQKSISRWERKLKDCKQLQAVYLLPNEELFITGKAQKIPKQFKETKGFRCNNH